MGLLDSDADELKKAAAQGASSGRKVNQSGLGALKGLKNYANLTAKYRKQPEASEEARTDAATSPTPASSEPVEQSRGTQDPGTTKVSAKSVQTEHQVSAGADAKVSAKSVQNDPTGAEQKSVQSQSEVSADPEIKVSAKSVQTSTEATALDGLEAPEVGALKASESRQTEVSAKSVQAGAKRAAEAAHNDQAADKVSAKSVQAQDSSMAIQPISKDSQSKASANEAQLLKGDALPKVSADERSEVSSKSVQTDASDPNVKSVQASTKASAEIETKVGAKSVQVSEKVSAAPSHGASTSTEASDTPSTVTTNRSTTREAQDSSTSRGALPGSAHPASLPPSRVTGQLGAPNEKAADESPTDQRPTSKRDAIVNLQVSVKSVHSEPKVSAKSVRTNTEPSANSVQSQCKVSSEVGAGAGGKLRQLGSTLEPLDDIYGLSASSMRVLHFMFQSCLWNNALVTAPITKQELISGTGLLEQTALSTVKRLRARRILDRHSYKDGRTGWTRYELAEPTYKELLSLDRSGKLQGMLASFGVSPKPQNALAVSAKVGAQVSASAPNSNSSLRDEVKKTTNTASPFDSLPEEWRTIELASLAETHCRMSKADLVALHQAGMLTAAEVQESIDHLAFDLKHATKPIERHVVFGVLKKRGAPWVSQRYLEKLENQIAEQEQAAERYRQMREEQKAAKSREGFENWFSSLSHDQKHELSQGSPFRDLNGQGFRSFALLHFEKLQSGGGEGSVSQTWDSRTIGALIDRELECSGASG